MVIKKILKTISNKIVSNYKVNGLLALFRYLLEKDMLKIPFQRPPLGPIPVVKPPLKPIPTLPPILEPIPGLPPALDPIPIPINPFLIKLLFSVYILKRIYDVFYFKPPDSPNSFPNSLVPKSDIPPSFSITDTDVKVKENPEEKKEKKKKPKNEKKILSLHLSGPFSIGDFVIFKEKNITNLSQADINHGQIGQVTERIDGWDYARVDFSIDVPDKFQKLNTNEIANKAFKEAVVIFEQK